MNKIIVATLLLGLNGTAFAALTPAPDQEAIDVSKSDSADEAQARPIPNVAGDIARIEVLSKRYEYELTKLNKEKGYDPEIHKLIVAAYETLSTITPSIKILQGVIDPATEVTESLSSIRDQITTIKKMNPHVPTYFPERCADASLATEYSVVQGFIDKGSGAPTRWALKTFDGKKEYPISRNVGLIGQGTLINPSYTPQNMRETGWVDSAGNVVCLQTELGSSKR